MKKLLACLIILLSFSAHAQTTKLHINTQTQDTLLATRGGTGQSSFTIGDIFYASSTTAISKLGIGATGKFLTVAAGIPAWGAAVTLQASTPGSADTGNSNISGASLAGNFKVTGTAGAGYIDLIEQGIGSIHSPASGWSLSGLSSGPMWINSSGNGPTFDFSAITATRSVIFQDANTKLPIFGQFITFTGPTAARTVALPNADFTVARTDAANTFTGTQTFSGTVDADILKTANYVEVVNAGGTPLNPASGFKLFADAASHIGFITQAGKNLILDISSTVGRTWVAPNADTYIPVLSQTVTFTGPTAARSYALPDAAATIMTEYRYIVREAPSGSINGSNTTFTLAQTPVSGKEMVFYNGQLWTPGSGNDYTISGGTITALVTPQTGDVLLVTYIY